MKKSNYNKLKNLIGKIEEMHERWEEVEQAEQQTYDNRSEKYLDSDKGSRDTSDMEALNSFVQALDDAKQALYGLSSDEDNE